MSGSSIGTIAGGIVGAIGGFFLENPMLGATLGMTIGGAIGGVVDSPKAQNVGGKTDDLSVQTATYGADIPRVYSNEIVTGNVFWVLGGKIQEVSKKLKSGGKGMGGKASAKSYSYYATFAVGLCEGPIAGIGRIWIGPKIICNLQSTDIGTVIASYQRYFEGFGDFSFQIYLGTEDQQPDGWIQADRGVANTPAYRGLAYIRFLNLPLKDFGNSLMGAQVRVEVIKKASLTSQRLLFSDAIDYPIEYFPYAIGKTYHNQLTFWSYPPYDTTINYLFDEYVPTNEKYQEISSTGVYIGTSKVQEKVPGDFSVYRPLLASTADVTIKIGVLNGHDVWWPEQSSTNSIQNGTYQIIPFGSLINKDTTFVQGSQGDVADSLIGESGRWVTGIIFGGDGQTSNYILITTGPNVRGVLSTADRYFILDYNLAIVKSGSISNTSQLMWSIPVSSRTVPSGGGVLILKSSEFTGWLAYCGIFNQVRYFYFDNADILQFNSPTTIPLSYSDLICTTAYINYMFYVLVHSYGLSAVHFMIFSDSEIPVTTDTTLSEIIENEIVNSELILSSDIDTTELTDIVRGYRISQAGSIRSSIDPLRAIWPFDIVQHGYKIKFKKRGSASVATIDISELDARAAGDKPGIQITNSREMDSQLPAEVKIKYQDYAREYDTNEQIAQRINTDAINKASYEFQVVLTADEAAQVASRLLYLYWMERYDVSFTLPPSYQAGEPGDVIDIISQDVNYNLRITSIDYTADGRIKCQAKYNDSAIYTQVSVGEDGPSPTTQTVSLPGRTIYELLDIPLLRDADNQPGFPAAMCGFNDAWTGGILYRSEDAGQTFTDILEALSPGSTMGQASGTLAVHDGANYDKKGILTATLFNGDLYSITEAQLFTGQNWFAYGDHGRWEIIAVLNCVLQIDGTYILTDFMRGLQGTEWATGLHQEYDKLILLDSSSLDFISLNAASIGVSKLYRGITDGYATDSDSDLSFAYQAVNLKPLSPCHLTGNRHPSTNDWALEWTRRSRFGTWANLIDAALGESVEAYEIDIFTSNTYATLKRTLTSYTPSVAYTSAQQVTDFGSNQSTLYLKIYQLSATVGRGYPLITSITR